MKNVVIYTDGACSGNPGPGGWGCLLRYGAFTKESSGGFRRTTNNRMEITAAIEALSMLNEPCAVELYSDSRYLVDAIQKGWVKRWQRNGWYRTKDEKAVNVDLWERLITLIATHKVTFIWVKGHASNEGNNRCDELAREAISKGDLPVDAGYV